MNKSNSGSWVSVILPGILVAATGVPEHVLTTAEHGDITLVSDGQRVIVYTER